LRLDDFFTEASLSLSTMGSALLNPPIEHTPLDPAPRELAAHSHAIASAPPSGDPDALRLEVAQRLAAHRNRRERLRPQPIAEASPTIPAATRSARIAASVAERFAHSPSYRAFLAAEAERATQQARAAAEIAALNAQAVAHAEQQLLESLYPAAPRLWPESEPDPIPSQATVSPSPELESSPATIRSTVPTRKNRTNASSTPTTPVDPGLTVRLFDADARTLHSLSTPNPRAATHKYPHDEAEARALDDEIIFRHAPVFEEPAGPPMALPANLIEFPRQLVASRKVRPRYAEGPLREDDAPPPGGSQLRIFEVDAAQISTVPGVAEAPTPQWTSLWLDAPNPIPTSGHATSEAADIEPASDSAAATLLNPYMPAEPRRHPASIPRRLIAAAIDGCLILAGFLASAITVALIALHAAPAPTGAHLHQLLAFASAALAGLQPATAFAAIVAALTFLYLLYQALFFSFSEATPGMRCARIALCTFSDENPTRRAMRRRILAVLLSACPLGLGFLWAALDEDRLAWHDLISRMYQRSY
jgi:uncharacterized RDD family membrane protein YckC